MEPFQAFFEFQQKERLKREEALADRMIITDPFPGILRDKLPPAGSVESSGTRSEEQKKKISHWSPNQNNDENRNEDNETNTVAKPIE